MEVFLHLPSSGVIFTTSAAFPPPCRRSVKRGSSFAGRVLSSAGTSTHASPSPPPSRPRPPSPSLPPVGEELEPGAEAGRSAPAASLAPPQRQQTPIASSTSALSFDVFGLGGRQAWERGGEGTGGGGVGGCRTSLSQKPERWRNSIEIIAQGRYVRTPGAQSRIHLQSTRRELNTSDTGQVGTQARRRITHTQPSTRAAARVNDSSSPPYNNKLLCFFFPC